MSKYSQHPLEIDVVFYGFIYIVPLRWTLHITYSLAPNLLIDIHAAAVWTEGDSPHKHF